MRKQMLALLLAVTVFLSLFAFSLPAQAAGGVTVSASISPGELLGAGPVTLTITVTNNTAEVINEVIIQAVNGPALVGPDGTGNVNLGNIAPGQSSQPFTQSNYQISADLIGANLEFKATWNFDTANSATGSCTVAKKAANVNVSITGKPDKTNVASGDMVTFSYTIVMCPSQALGWRMPRLATRTT